MRGTALWDGLMPRGAMGHTRATPSDRQHDVLAVVLWTWPALGWSLTDACESAPIIDDVHTGTAVPLLIRSMHRDTLNVRAETAFEEFGVRLVPRQVCARLYPRQGARHRQIFTRV